MYYDGLIERLKQFIIDNVNNITINDNSYKIYTDNNCYFKVEQEVIKYIINGIEIINITNNKEIKAINDLINRVTMLEGVL